jgi:hypothetical protein
MGWEKLKLLKSKEQTPTLFSLQITSVVSPNNIRQNLFSAYAIIGVIL